MLVVRNDISKDFIGVMMIYIRFYVILELKKIWTFVSWTLDVISLEENLSITTGRYDLAIATHARKMLQNLFVVVHPEVLDND